MDEVGGVTLLPGTLAVIHKAWALARKNDGI